MALSLPDIIITDRESPRKCSIAPLAGRADLRFLPSTQVAGQSFAGYLLLHVDGEPLTTAEVSVPLLLVDASWKRALRVNQQLALLALPRRSLPGFVTVYPRVSRLYTMPDDGLASVEALYIARLIQGREDLTLLEHYHWREQFLAANSERFEAIRLRITN